jgi:hypothetical protein
MHGWPSCAKTWLMQGSRHVRQDMVNAETLYVGGNLTRGCFLVCCHRITNTCRWHKPALISKTTLIANLAPLDWLQLLCKLKEVSLCWHKAPWYKLKPMIILVPIWPGLPIKGPYLVNGLGEADIKVHCSRSSTPQWLWCVCAFVCVCTFVRACVCPPCVFT